MSRIRCMPFSDCIKPLQNIGHAHYSDAIKCDPNYCSASHEHQYECLAAFWVLARVIHDF